MVLGLWVACGTISATFFPSITVRVTVGDGVKVSSGKGKRVEQPER